YIRLIINPLDDEAFKRIINYPARGIGDTTVERIGQLAAARGCSMWEAIDQLVQETPADATQRAIIRKVTEFVDMIRSLSLGRHEKELYDFGLEIASKSGILAQYRASNSPENSSALANIEELLNSMQEFKERCDAEIRNGERDPEERATVEEWLQGVMLMTDMDSDDPNDQNKVTLMTVHSAKGLEYKYVYIVGVEEKLFPSERAMESPEGLEEERRLFYVALTRAKCTAVLSYAEMRFRWGQMDFSRPSCFLKEIDPQYIDSEVDFRARRTAPTPSEEGVQAIDELRRRFDYRFQQKRQQEGRGERGTYGGGYGGSRPSDGESGRVQRFSRANDPYRSASTSHPHPRTQYDAEVGSAVERLGGSPRRLISPTTNRPATPSGAAGEFHVGDRVEHPLFGRGEIVMVEAANGDQKLSIDFGTAGRKTLLARYAKLRKL
ncbi:MAG: ATP-binding domain-containing protein, partial [Alistipes sp.]|nr:ATP-binding domain-containing protein [Alistipes sp.]